MEDIKRTDWLINLGEYSRESLKKCIELLQKVNHEKVTYLTETLMMILSVKGI